MPMPRLAPVLFVAALVGGCQSQRGKLITAGITAGIALPSTYAIATWDGTVPVVLTATAITTSALALGALLAGLNHQDTPRFVQSIRIPDHREEAWEYTKLAAAAARNGDCEAVLAYQRVVRELDDDFHTVVFARDAAILRCLVATSPVTQPPQPPVPARPTPAAEPAPASFPLIPAR